MYLWFNIKLLRRVKKVFRLFIFIFFIFLTESFHYLYSQQKYFRVYTARDGLPSSTIPACPDAKTVFQDGDGFIWLATFGGVSIYDGYRFINHTVENGNLSDDNVLNFFQRSKNETWVVESVCTDVFVNRKRVKTIPIGSISGTGYVTSQYLLSKDGRVLAARNGFIFEISNYQLKQIAPFPHYVSRMYQAGNYFILQDGINDSLFLVDNNFQKIVATQKGRLFEDRYHQFWLFNSQFYLLDTVALQQGSFKSLSTVSPVNNLNLYGKRVFDFLYDRDGYYWLLIAGEKAVLRIDPENHTRLFHIPSDYFISLMEDRDGNIWIPADAGFYKYYNKYNDFYSEEEGLPSKYITGIAVDRKSGAAWLANRNGFSCIYQNYIFNFPYPNGPSVFSRISARSDSLWVLNNGLFLYKINYSPNPEARLIKKWQPRWRPDDFVDYSSFSYDDNSGLVFLNKFSEGLFYIKGGSQLKKIHDAGLTSFFIDGNELWTGKPWGGVSRWKIIWAKDSLHLRLMQHYAHLPDDVIRSITRDSAGNFWMGTAFKGILKFEKQKNDTFFVRNYDSKYGLMNPWVLQISVNKKGEIFAGTMGGLCQLHCISDSVYIEDLSTRFGDVYTTWDFDQDSYGNFWLATPMGVIHVLNNLYKKTPAPVVFFTQLLKNNHPDSSIFKNITPTYRYNENNLAFEFSAASFRNEEKVLYSYRLIKGTDSSKWSTPQNIHTLSLVSLSPGSYTLEVNAVSAEKVWSETPSHYSFIIKPPYWTTTWFRSIIILLIAGAIYAFYRYRINQLKKLVEVRTKISRDLHDDVGSALSGIGLLSEVALQQLQKEKSTEAQRSLQKINTSSEETLEKMSDIVWAINPQNDSFEKVMSKLRNYAKTITQPLGIRLHFDSASLNRDFDLPMQKRNNIYLICKEAINNAVKYSGCQNLTVSVRQDDHQISININDDGKGFDMKQASEGNGLKNMQARAQEIKAGINLHSETGKGTSLKLSVNIT